MDNKHKKKSKSKINKDKAAVVEPKDAPVEQNDISEQVEEAAVVVEDSMGKDISGEATDDVSTTVQQPSEIVMEDSTTATAENASLEGEGQVLESIDSSNDICTETEGGSNNINLQEGVSIASEEEANALEQQPAELSPKEVAVTESDHTMDSSNETGAEAEAIPSDDQGTQQSIVSNSEEEANALEQQRMELSSNDKVVGEADHAEPESCEVVDTQSVAASVEQSIGDSTQQDVNTVGEAALAVEDAVVTATETTESTPAPTPAPVPVIELEWCFDLQEVDLVPPHQLPVKTSLGMDSIALQSILDPVICEAQLVLSSERRNSMIQSSASRSAAISANVDANSIIDHGALPLMGVRFSYLTEFAAMIGGRDSIASLTTAEVREMVASMTQLSPSVSDSDQQTTDPKVMSLSLCEQLLFQHNRADAIGEKADWYVIHSHGELFVNFVDSIESFLETEYLKLENSNSTASDMNKKKFISNTVLWIDIFCTPQIVLAKQSNSSSSSSSVSSTAEERPLEWYQHKLLNTIKSIGNTMLVITDFDRPIALSRAWCIYELFACVHKPKSIYYKEYHKYRFEIASPKGEYTKFLHSLCVDGCGAFYTVLRSIKSETTKSTFESDKHGIHNALLVLLMLFKDENVSSSKKAAPTAVTSAKANADSSVDNDNLFLKVDSIVRSALEQWLMSVINHQLSLYSTPIATAAAAASVVASSDQQDRFLQQSQWQFALADAYKCQGKYEIALPMATLALESRIVAVGEHSNETHSMILYIGYLQELLRDYAAAEAEYDRCLRLKQGANMMHDQSYLIVINKLADLYRIVNKIDKCIEMYQLCLVTSTRLFGNETEFTITAAKNLGLLYIHVKNYKEAEELLTVFVKHSEKAMGSEGRVTLSLVYDLATVNKLLGNQSRCEELLVRCIEGFQSLFGPDHPDTCKSVFELAMLSYTQENYPKAEQLFERARASYIKAVGPNHRDTANAMEYLANSYMKQDKLEAAEQHYITCLRSREICLGKDHLLTLKVKICVADLFKRRCTPLNKEDTTRRFAAAVTNKGSGNSNTAPSSSEGGKVTNNVKLLAETEQLYRECLQLSEKLNGFNHIDSLHIANRLAQVFYSQLRDELAEPLMHRCLAACDATLGVNHPETFIAINNLASLFQAQEKYAASEKLLVRCLQGREQALGTDHPDTQRSMVNLAKLYAMQNKHDDALLLLTRCLGIRERVLGKEDPKTVLTAISIEDVKELKKKHQEQCVVM